MAQIDPMKTPALPTALTADLAIPGPGARLRCVACAHRCSLADGSSGVCRVRFRQGESLAVPWGYVAGVAVDPVEKKPFYHFHPGARALSFGMLGCDLRCPYCQNWFTSQSLRDDQASQGFTPTTAERLIQAALDHRCAVITSTYNEPLITAEWAREIFKAARASGLATSFVSNGHATPEVLDYLTPLLDAMKVDLKCFSAGGYRTLGGSLQAVLDTITELMNRGIWTEVVTLVVPGFNDARAELQGIAEFLVGLSTDLPWHVTAFHPDYHMTDRTRTPLAALETAVELGRAAGLRYVYAGNLGGRRSDLEHTRCWNCRELLVAREGYLVTACRLGDNSCPSCGAHIAGIW